MKVSIEGMTTASSSPVVVEDCACPLSTVFILDVKENVFEFPSFVK